MGKTLGTMAFVLTMGVGGNTLLRSVWGNVSEAAVVTCMGVGLLTLGRLMGGLSRTPAENTGSTESAQST